MNGVIYSQWGGEIRRGGVPQSLVTTKFKALPYNYINDYVNVNYDCTVVKDTYVSASHHNTLICNRCKRYFVVKDLNCFIARMRYPKCGCREIDVSLIQDTTRDMLINAVITSLLIVDRMMV